MIGLLAGLLLAPQGAGARFTDVTRESGIDFRHRAGSGRLLILDTMGCGLACADFDGDGDDDLYLLTGSRLDPLPKGESPPVNRLYRNDGGLRFTDVTAGSGTGLSGWSMGAVAGDYDGDGDLDLYVTRFGANVLLRNEGALRFTDVTAAAGVGDERWGTGAVFFDCDGDGDLDLYVANYVDFAGRLARCGGDLDHPEFRGFKQLPHYFDAEPDVLYRNEGDGRFTDVTSRAIARGAHGKGLGACAGDFDDDGDADLYVAGDTTANALLVNRGDGTFDELGAEAGAALSSDGRPEGSMGVACGDVDGDGRDDLLVTNFDNEPNSLYVNGEGLAFTEQSRAAGLDPATRPFVGWACELADFDGDGDLDAFFANGHVVTAVPLFLIRHLLPAERLPGVIEPEHFGSGYEQSLLLFENDGRGRFRRAGRAAGACFGRDFAGRGGVAADLDLDGDLDLVVTQSNGPALVLRNETSEGREARAWIAVGLADSGPNHFGVGARIEVRAGGRRLRREVRCGEGYLSQRPLFQHFGLGAHAGPVELRVTVRGGEGQVLRLVRAGRVVHTVTVAGDPFDHTFGVAAGASWYRVETADARGRTTVGNPVFLREG